jgi:hypothetical protein
MDEYARTGGTRRARRDGGGHAHLMVVSHESCALRFVSNDGAVDLHDLEAALKSTITFSRAISLQR